MLQSVFTENGCNSFDSALNSSALSFNYINPIFCVVESFAFSGNQPLLLAAYIRLTHFGVVVVVVVGADAAIVVVASYSSLQTFQRLPNALEISEKRLNAACEYYKPSIIGRVAQIFAIDSTSFTPEKTSDVEKNIHT